MNEMLNKKDVLDAIEKKMKVVNEADGDADVILGLAAAMSTVKQMQAAPVNPAEKVGHWIPVSERLPEWHWETYGDEKVWDGERVLACVKEADEYYDLVGVAKYGPYGWESEDEGFCSCLASKPVIAWMPLPEPYKESRQG